MAVEIKSVSPVFFCNVYVYVFMCASVCVCVCVLVLNVNAKLGKAKKQSMQEKGT